MESKQGLTLAAACLNNRGQSFVQRLKGSSNGSPTPPAYNDELRTRTSADEVRGHNTSSLSLSLSLSLSHSLTHSLTQFINNFAHSI
jgi:hypothetical protein